MEKKEKRKKTGKKKIKRSSSSAVKRMKMKMRKTQKKRMVGGESVRDNCKNPEFHVLPYEKMKLVTVPPTLAELVYLFLDRDLFIRDFISVYKAVKTDILQLSKQTDSISAITDQATKQSIQLPLGFTVAISLNKTSLDKNTLINKNTPIIPLPKKGGGNKRGFPPTLREIILAMHFTETPPVEEPVLEETPVEETPVEEIPVEEETVENPMHNKPVGDNVVVGGGGGNVQTAAYLYKESCVPRHLQQIPRSKISLAETLYTYRLVPTIDELLITLENKEIQAKLVEIIGRNKGMTGKNIISTGSRLISGAIESTVHGTVKLAKAIVSGAVGAVSAAAAAVKESSIDKNVYPGESSGVPNDLAMQLGINLADIGNLTTTDVTNAKAIGEFEFMRNYNEIPSLKMWIAMFKNPVFVMNLRNKMIELSNSDKGLPVGEMCRQILDILEVL